MSALVKVSDTGNYDELWVNPDEILAVVDEGRDKARIFFPDTTITVPISAQAIVDILRGSSKGYERI